MSNASSGCLTVVFIEIKAAKGIGREDARIASAIAVTVEPDTRIMVSSPKPVTNIVVEAIITVVVPPPAGTRH